MTDPRLVIPHPSSPVSVRLHIDAVNDVRVALALVERLATARYSLIPGDMDLN